MWFRCALAVVLNLLLNCVYSKPWGPPPPFPNLALLSSGALSLPLRIAYPMPDLSPITIQFADPSLRNYPDPNVPAAAVKPLPDYSTSSNQIIQVKGKEHHSSYTTPSSYVDIWVGNNNNKKKSIKKTNNKKKYFKPSPRLYRKKRQIEPDFFSSFDEGQDDFFANNPRQGRKQSAAEVAQEVFSPELIPLGASDPSFALPVVHEDPHFSPDYQSDSFNLEANGPGSEAQRPPSIGHPAHLAAAFGTGSRGPRGFKFTSSGGFPEDKVKLSLVDHAR